MAQFYTLEEAARVLGMDSEELKAKAQRREVRAFLDSGSWRFRVSDIDELARRSGMGSDADLSLSDLDLSGSAGPPPEEGTNDEEAEGSGSVFNLGVARSDVGPASGEAVPTDEDSNEDDVLLDDTSLPTGSGSSSHIIGMDAPGKEPSDSDVRLVPEDGPRAPSDSDVQLSGEVDATRASSSSSDAEPTMVQESSDEIDAFATMEQTPGSSDELMDLSAGSGFGDLGAESDSSSETSLRPSPVGQGDQEGPPSEGESQNAEEDSDFELTPSSVIDALEPESGSDFELTALDGSDEFEAEPPKPSDSDVTGAEPSTSGINLSKPSDSGINLQQVGDLEDAESIELAPLDDEDDQPKQPPKPKPKPKQKSDAAVSEQPDPSATALPGQSPAADPSATALPGQAGAQKDIFEDTDFEVDALDDESDDQTVQVGVDEDSDFSLEDDGDSASEVFALDEEDVDQSAATAMGPAVLEEEDALGAAVAEEDEAVASDEMEPVGWDEEAEPAGPAARPDRRRGGAGPAALTDAGNPWSGVWVGVLGVTTVLMMVLTFVTMDVVRNLNSYQGETPASGLVNMIAGEQ